MENSVPDDSEHFIDVRDILEGKVSEAGMDTDADHLNKPVEEDTAVNITWIKTSSYNNYLYVPDRGEVHWEGSDVGLMLDAKNTADIIEEAQSDIIHEELVKEQVHADEVDPVAAKVGEQVHIGEITGKQDALAGVEVIEHIEIKHVPPNIMENLKEVMNDSEHFTFCNFSKPLTISVD